MPTLTVIAGPNGSGKSTITQFAGFERREELLDPDAIARHLNPSNPSAAVIAAGKGDFEADNRLFPAASELCDRDNPVQQPDVGANSQSQVPRL